MEMQKFEEKLIQMTKPDVLHLKHEDMLANAITKAKDKSVVSLWWLIIPLYIVAALTMKTIFMPRTTLLSNLHELTSNESYTSVVFFFVLPILFIIINVKSMRNIYFLSGNPKMITFLKETWYHVLILILSVLILIIYSL